jgi:hypothetical protein
MDTGHFLIVRTEADWIKQVNDSLATIREKNGGQDPANLRASYDVDPKAFGKLIEAMHALGAEVDAEMMSLAGMRPVDEVI